MSNSLILINKAYTVLSLIFVLIYFIFIIFVNSNNFLSDLFLFYTGFLMYTTMYLYFPLQILFSILSVYYKNLTEYTGLVVLFNVLTIICLISTNNEDNYPMIFIVYGITQTTITMYYLISNSLKCF